MESPCPISLRRMSRPVSHVFLTWTPTEELVESSYRYIPNRDQLQYFPDPFLPTYIPHLDVYDGTHNVLATGPNK
eukprot:scaffold270537_cov35-Attheya_sp.AAC.1